MKLLNYVFKNEKLLELALTHRSHAHEVNKQSEKRPLAERHNERLEFLGDTILEMVISEVLLNTYPDSSEGDLTVIRSTLVNEKTLALIARSLRMGETLRLGRGEESTGGRHKDSILAGALEALVAAIYMDQGYEVARDWIIEVFQPAVEETKKRSIHVDYKTTLQELVQAKLKVAPKYETVKSHGPDHDKRFEVALSIQGKVLGRGFGRSKKEAEQDAARCVLENTDKQL